MTQRGAKNHAKSSRRCEDMDRQT